jgi:hypothetical protein
MKNETKTELEKRLIDAPRMRHEYALVQFGMSLVGISDLAKIRKQIIESGETFRNLPGYFWTGDFIGYAPENHPAKGNLIMARISGYDMTKESQATDLCSSISGNASRKGQIIPSNTEFALLGDNQKISMLGSLQPNRLILHFGKILDFEEINGLMVPITDGSWCDEVRTKEEDFPHFGHLVVHNYLMNPINMRVAGFYLPGRPVFENSVHSENTYSVLTKQD